MMPTESRISLSSLRCLAISYGIKEDSFYLPEDVNKGRLTQCLTSCERAATKCHASDPFGDRHFMGGMVALSNLKKSCFKASPSTTQTSPRTMSK